MASAAAAEAIPRVHSFERRHNSIPPAEMKEMLQAIGFPSLDALIDATVPKNIRRKVRELATSALLATRRSGGSGALR